LAGGGSYPSITVSVDVAGNASSPQVNQAGVSGGGSGSASASDSTTVVAPGAILLSIVKTHAGNFTQGQQGAQYTLTVSNAAGAAATTGSVTVTEIVPSGLTLVSMAGQGWRCVSNSCVRGDQLA